MNFFRGTGIAGLHGILPRQGNIVRPLLCAWKEDLRRFALDHCLDWAEDSSNESDKYTRNYFRHQVIPLVSQLIPGALHNLAGNIQRFREIGELYHQSVQWHMDRLLETKGNEVRIPVLKLKKTIPMAAIVYEIIKGYGFSPQQVNETIDLLDRGSGRYIQSSTHRILRHRNWLIIAPHPSSQAQTIVIGSGDERPVYENGTLFLELLSAETTEALGDILREPAPEARQRANNAAVKARPRGDSSIALLDADRIQFPLLLRKWRPGDYFYPLGLSKKKKLGRFFIDNKLSLTDKEKIWVIEMDKKIIWVVGLRIDDRFRITPQTRQILKIESRHPDLANEGIDNIRMNQDRKGHSK
jgi:tRNA(Ile)-lysidine synthase